MQNHVESATVRITNGMSRDALIDAGRQFVESRWAYPDLSKLLGNERAKVECTRMVRNMSRLLAEQDPVKSVSNALADAVEEHAYCIAVTVPPEPREDIFDVRGPGVTGELVQFLYSIAEKSSIIKILAPKWPGKMSDDAMCKTLVTHTLCVGTWSGLLCLMRAAMEPGLEGRNRIDVGLLLQSTLRSAVAWREHQIRKTIGMPPVLTGNPDEEAEKLYEVVNAVRRGGMPQRSLDPVAVNKASGVSKVAARRPATIASAGICRKSPSGRGREEDYISVEETQERIEFGKQLIAQSFLARDFTAIYALRTEEMQEIKNGMIESIERMFTSGDQRMSFNHGLADTLEEYAYFQALLLMPDQGPDYSRLKGNNGITGGLTPYLGYVVTKSEKIAALFSGGEPKSGDELVSKIVERYNVVGAWLEIQCALRVAMEPSKGRATFGRPLDFLRPVLIAATAWREHEIRKLLKMPPTLKCSHGSDPDAEAAKLYAIVQSVREGVENLDLQAGSCGPDTTESNTLSVH